MNLIASEYENAGLVFDRLPSDTFSLPNKLENIKIQPNELATASTFNYQFKKLYDNFLYLYGLCFMVGYKRKKDASGWFDEGSGYLPDSYSATLNIRSRLYTPDLITSKKAVSFSQKNNQIYTVFASTSSVGIFTLESIFENIGEFEDVIISSYSGRVVFTQTSIDPVSGSILFKNISSISQYNNELLYVADSVYNNIYNYNLKDAVGDDNIKKNILFQLNVVGGTGSVTEPIKFNNPAVIVNIKDYILVVDANNRCFKLFDKNLNWTNTITQTVFFKQYTNINCAVYHEKSNSLIFGTDNAIHIFKIIDFNNIVHEKTIILDAIDTAERILDLKLAFFNADVLYVLTTKRIFKKWFTKLDKNIYITQIPTLDWTYDWIALTPVNLQTDVMLVKGGTDSYAFLMVIQEALYLQSLLKQDNFEIYTKEDLLVGDEEYISSWTYNKCLKKLVYNLNLLVNNIAYRFYTKEDAATKAISYSYKTYNSIVLNKQLKDTNTFANIFINENFQSETINRCFSQIYEYQEYILTKLIDNDPVNVDLIPYISE